MIENQIDEYRQALLSEISARCVASRVQQLRNADAEYADVRRTSGEADWDYEDECDRLQNAVIENADDSAGTDEDVERASSSATQPKSGDPLASVLPFQQTK